MLEWEEAGVSEEGQGGMEVSNQSECKDVILVSCQQRTDAYLFTVSSSGLDEH